MRGFLNRLRTLFRRGAGPVPVVEDAPQEIPTPVEPLSSHTPICCLTCSRRSNRPTDFVPFSGMPIVIGSVKYGICFFCYRHKYDTPCDGDSCSYDPEGDFWIVEDVDGDIVHRCWDVRCAIQAAKTMSDQKNDYYYHGECEDCHGHTEQASLSKYVGGVYRSGQHISRGQTVTI